jgi:hypothetical protein
MNSFWENRGAIRCCHLRLLLCDFYASARLIVRGDTSNKCLKVNKDWHSCCACRRILKLQLIRPLFVWIREGETIELPFQDTFQSKFLHCWLWHRRSHSPLNIEWSRHVWRKRMAVLLSEDPRQRDGWNLRSLHWKSNLFDHILSVFFQNRRCEKDVIYSVSLMTLQRLICNSCPDSLRISRKCPITAFCNPALFLLSLCTLWQSSFPP